MLPGFHLLLQTHRTVVDHRREFDKFRIRFRNRSQASYLLPSNCLVAVHIHPFVASAVHNHPFDFDHKDSQRLDCCFCLSVQHSLLHTLCGLLKSDLSDTKWTSTTTPYREKYDLTSSSVA